MTDQPTDDDNRPLLCAWCGKPVPAVECIIRQTTTRRASWHLACADEDPLRAVDAAMVWADWATIALRGPDRIGPGAAS